MYFMTINRLLYKLFPAYCSSIKVVRVLFPFNTEYSCLLRLLGTFSYLSHDLFLKVRLRIIKIINGLLAFYIFLPWSKSIIRPNIFIRSQEWLARFFASLISFTLIVFHATAHCLQLFMDSIATIRTPSMCSKPCLMLSESTGILGKIAMYRNLCSFEYLLLHALELHASMGNFCNDAEYSFHTEYFILMSFLLN